MRNFKSAGRVFQISLALFCLSVSSVKAATVDTVFSFAPGAGSGVINVGGGPWAGPTGSGTFDQAAVTALDGVNLALGGTSANPGRITVGFSTGSVVDGAGADIRIYDSFGGSEGIIVEASNDGTNFFGMGSSTGLPSVLCSAASPCFADFDLSVAGLLSASIFRLTVTDRVISGFPQAFDLDTLEALNFQAAAVPVPAAVWLFGTALIGLLGIGKRKQAA